MKRENEGFSRRAFLRRTALISMGTIAAGTVAPEVAEAADPPPPTHGSELRGIKLTSQNRTAEGRFGIMFKQLPAFAPPEDLLIQLASNYMEEQPRSNQPTNATDTLPAKPNDFHNEAMNPPVPGQPLTPSSLLTAGVTFLGQFIDHDITFDNTPLSDQQKDPNALKSFRTPRFDLDSIYGRGPAYDPIYYDRANTDPYSRSKFRFTKYSPCAVTTDPSGFTEDLINGIENVPRRHVTFPDGSIKKLAIIPEPRNDQSQIVHQLHIAFMKFHNELVEHLRRQGVSASAVFDLARRNARWHFQWLVIHDFLKRIVDPAIVDDVYINGPRFYDPSNREDRAFLPVEWAVAAYRFGHSMARPRYSVRDIVVNNATKTVSGVPLFGPVIEEDQITISPIDNLEGQRPIPREELLIQWSLFFNDPLAAAGSTLSKSAKPARKIDATLSFPLFYLPRTILPATETSPEIMLAKRNLLRGVLVGLPSGQKVAQALGVQPLSNEELARRHRFVTTTTSTTDAQGVTAWKWAVTGEEIVPDAALAEVLRDPRWNGEAPLWFYILKEAELTTGGRRLGPVGGRIVAEVLVGLLRRDPGSYYVMNKNWTPKTPIARKDGQFTIVDLLTFAKVYPGV